MFLIELAFFVLPSYSQSATDGAQKEMARTLHPTAAFLLRFVCHHGHRCHQSLPFNSRLKLISCAKKVSR
jgi:hypothetical protein